MNGRTFKTGEFVVELKLFPVKIFKIYFLTGPVVIGVISCCARDQQNEVSHPHVNIAIPSYILAVALDAFHSLGIFSFSTYIFIYLLNIIYSQHRGVGTHHAMK